MAAALSSRRWVRRSKRSRWRRSSGCQVLGLRFRGERVRWPWRFSHRRHAWQPLKQQAHGRASRRARAIPLQHGAPRVPVPLLRRCGAPAPDDPGAVLKLIKQASGSWEDAIAVGLATWREGERSPFRTFRDWMMIRSATRRGRCIGFGGRAMAPGVRAKYLNTAETPWFDKGRTLYNVGRARSATARGAPLLVVEGYMDVIGLTQAGLNRSGGDARNRHDR